jgi:hypothetical protein
MLNGAAGCWSAGCVIVVLELSLRDGVSDPVCNDFARLPVEDILVLIRRTCIAEVRVSYAVDTGAHCPGAVLFYCLRRGNRTVKSISSLFDQIPPETGNVTAAKLRGV